MFRKAFTLTKLFGIEIKLDPSWLILFVVLVWSLWRGVFPFHYKALPQSAYFGMGLIAVLGLFASIVFHELCHALVAKHYKIPIRSIRLFIFGGAAELESEPTSPRGELLMAIAGPGASLFIGLLLDQMVGYARMLSWPVPIIGVLGYLSSINIVLAIFNLIPAFPLDGGRVLRALLWTWKRDLRWATRIASGLGAGFGWLLILFGIYRLFQTDLVGGLWFFLIGMFLRNAAETTYEQLLMRRVFEGHTVRCLMRIDPVAVPAGVSLRSLVEDYFYRYYFKMFPVVEDGNLLGCVSLAQVREVPKGEWDLHTVRELVKPCGAENAVSPDANLLHALSTMSRAHVSTLLVVDQRKIVGILSHRDIMSFLTVKLELEGAESSAATIQPTSASAATTA